MSTPKRPVRIANASGFLGDRESALREMVLGGPIDFVTGDYLAEVTMLILGRQWMKDPKTGYAKAFLRHVEPVLGTILERGIKVVVNAGGLNPAGLAEAIHELGARLGVSPKVATVTGDNLRPDLEALAKAHPFTNLENGKSLPNLGLVFTANAYLGAWGIVEGLRSGADIVVTGRVTDASLVVGPAAYWHGWGRHDWNALAGAVAAGHIIECGAQATGGNYSGFRKIEDLLHPGFPIAEVAADGTSVITKHDGTAGAVDVGTVTAQLVYEVGGPDYLNPDVTTRLDTVRLEQVGKDKVRVHGAFGAPPPSTTKVAITTAGGFANEMTFVFTGLHVDEKMRLFEEGAKKELAELVARTKAKIEFQRIGTPAGDPRTENEACVLFRVVARGKDEESVGRAFSSALIELGLASYPGLFAIAPPEAAHPTGRFWPALIPQSAVPHKVISPDGATIDVPSPDVTEEPKPRDVHVALPAAPTGPTRRVPLGRLAAARSGDKGSDANVGLWVETDAAFAWLAREMTEDRLRQLLPECASLDVSRTVFANLNAVNFVVSGILEGGAAATLRFDRQAKALGEFLRSRVVDVPVSLLEPES